MTNSNIRRFIAIASVLILYGVGQSDNRSLAEDRKDTGGVQQLSFPPSPIPVTSVDVPDPHCDFWNNGSLASSQVVRLHLTSAMFEHLSDGQMNQCDTSTPPKCYAYVDTTAIASICTNDPATATSNAQTYCVDTDNPKKLGPTIPLLTSATKAGQTRLDINLAGVDANGSAIWGTMVKGNYPPILLEIVLDDSNLSFIPGPNGPTDPSYALQTDATTATKYPGMFECLQPIDVSARTIRLRVNHLVNPPHAAGRLNIGINVQETTCTAAPCLSIPIIIDPIFENNG